MKKLEIMKLTVILVIAGTLGAVTKKLEKRLDELEIKGKTETIHSTTLQKSVSAWFGFFV